MNDVTKEIRDVARELLQNGDVIMVIGYEQGTLKNRTHPTFIEKPEDIDKLVWNEYCTNNLSRYLTDYKEADSKIAIVVKGCDAKAVVTLLQEHQIDREKVHLIGVECHGVKDSNDVILDKCHGCTTAIPPLFDHIIKSEGTTPEKLQETLADQIEKMSLAERAAFWEKRFSNCIRCYACRQACPLCYCTECFVEKHFVRWISKEVNPSENWLFHLTRALHLAGRCIGCGECIKACPMNLPLGALSEKLTKEIKELFDYEPGFDPAAPSPLATFTKGDPDLAPEESK